MSPPARRAQAEPVQPQQPRAQGAWRLLLASSTALLHVERAAIMGFMMLLTVLILLNVVTRYGGRPIYWIDESAVYSIVWLTFIGASAMTRLRLDFAVTLLTERLSERARVRAKAGATLAVVLFGLLLLYMCWLWLDPLGLAAAGFDARAFAAETFNFIYTERTQTLDWPTWALYLIVPIFAASITLHGLANLVEDLGLAPAARLPAFAPTAADSVN